MRRSGGGDGVVSSTDVSSGGGVRLGLDER